ncbi:MAG: DUF1549 and DUF1553 domain-containing protein [Pirellulaceae bacterium]
MILPRIAALPALAWLLLGVISLSAGRAIAEEGDQTKILPSASERYAADAENPPAPNFQRHVVTLLGRLGCNGRSCHGSFQGQGGFRLSMFGYDFAADHEALAGGDEPRVNLDKPDDSLILNKPTDEFEHGGGLRYKKGGWEYHLLRSWIRGGAKNDSEHAGDLVSLEVTPSRLEFSSDGQPAQLRALARWSDGTVEDVTCLTRFSTNDDAVADVTPEGLVRSTGGGLTFIIASYDRDVVPVQVLRPVSQFVGEKFPDVPTPTKIDKLIAEQLAKLGVVPSSLCSDEEFLRRVSLDITGTLPSAEEVEAFLADQSPNRREAKIDELLQRPAYVAWWTTKLNDVLGLNAAAQLGGTEMAKQAGELWMKWMTRRVAENYGYDEIARGILLAKSRASDQTYQDYVDEWTSYLRKKDPVDFALRDDMPLYWFRRNLAQPNDAALAVGYAFLGIRLECAQCHKHPFDQWSQQDFQQFTAFFDRVDVGYAPDAEQRRRELEETVGLKDFKNAAERRQTYRRLGEQGEAIVPWQEVYVVERNEKKHTTMPKLLGGIEPQLGPQDDPRVPLVDWMLADDNPYFAKAFVNRIWAHYFGTGIVDPPDDFNLANPPSNPALLDWLAEEFIAHDYDMKWLHRTITTSRAYQLSWRPNDTNRHDTRNFSRALPRRLPAEVVVDAITMATAGEKERSQLAADAAKRRIAEQPPATVRSLDYSLAVFGKPIRETNCDCERQADPSLQQSIFMRNDKDLWAKIDRKGGWLSEVKPDADQDDLIREVYARTLSRQPRDAELARSREHFKSTGAAEGARDLLWALLNTQEFLTNH